MAPRFNPNSDSLLLKEVVAVNPYATVKGRNEWEKVVNSLNLVDGGVDKNAFKIKSCQARIRTLSQAHKNKEMASLSTEEDYTQRDAHLTDLVDLIEETNAETSNTKDKRAEEEQKELKRVMVREAAMQSLKRYTPHVESANEDNEEKDVARVDETPSRKRRSDIVEDYMNLRLSKK